MLSSSADLVDVGGKEYSGYRPNDQTSRPALWIHHEGGSTFNQISRPVALAEGAKPVVPAQAVPSGSRLEDAAEMGENHEQQPLHSINNDHRSFVRFINSTQRNVTLYWIDYQGQAISYGIMTPGDTKDINTFVTHPWIFVDNETRDRYMVNQKDVFFPEPWFAKYPGLRQSEMPQRSERTTVHITLRIYTLRELALRATRRLLTRHRQAYQLDIPRSLQNELAEMLRAEEVANGDDQAFTCKSI